MNEILNDQTLLPAQAVEYFEDAKNLSKDYLKAVSIRNCLEAIVDTVFVHIAKKEGSYGNWKDKNLNTKIESLKNFFPKKVLDSIHYIRKVTNKGAHQSGHKDLTSQELYQILEDINHVCEWVIVSYLKKYGFGTESWVPTVLSTLRPCYRVNILKELFEYCVNNIVSKDGLLKYQVSIQEYNLKIINGDFTQLFHEPKPDEESKQYEQILLVIDKLAMAYLKNREYETSLEFIGNCYNSGLINDVFKKDMIEKIGMLQEQIDDLPIAQNIQQTQSNLKKILPAIKKEDHSLFLTIFIAIVAQDEKENYKI